MGLYNPQDQGQGCISINPKTTAGCGHEAETPGCCLKVDATTQGLGGPCRPSELFLAGGKHLGAQLESDGGSNLSPPNRSTLCSEE